MLTVLLTHKEENEAQNAHKAFCCICIIWLFCMCPCKIKCFPVKYVSPKEASARLKCMQICHVSLCWIRVTALQEGRLWAEKAWSCCLSLFLTLSVCTTQSLSSQQSATRKEDWPHRHTPPKEFLRNGSLTSDCEIFPSWTLQRQVPGKWTTKKEVQNLGKPSSTARSASHWVFLKKEKEKKINLTEFRKGLCVHSPSPAASLSKSHYCNWRAGPGFSGRGRF